MILGSTGSIGTSALKVARAIPERMEVVGLAAGTRIEDLAAQAKEFGVTTVAIADESKVEALRALVPSGTTVLAGAEGMEEMATLAEAEMVLVSIVGTSGLRPTLAAIRAGKDLAVASKEILVMAGEIVMREAQAAGVAVLPVDSEHNAIFQCLSGQESNEVQRLILTASGGPFRRSETKDLAEVTVAQALNHPTWKMGPKITIDSATMFNKGLEMIEARWLFGVEMARVEVVVHPQSIVHSMVEFVDGSVIAQMSTTDMCFPIQYAVTWPDRVPTGLTPLDFGALSQLNFEAPREDVFPSLRLAREAGERCGTLPAVFNAANEVAVEHFLAGKGRFLEIAEIVEGVMRAHQVVASPSLEVILEADLEARELAADLLESQL